MLPAIGKISKEVFDEIIYRNLGKRRRTVILGPRHGVDAAAISLGDEVLVIAEDPTFGMPVIMPYFGWAIVHICASDVAVLGVRPMYMTISLLLPPGTSVETLRSIWAQIHEECDKLGISIVGGHTGVYPGISYPLNGGCTVIGVGRRKDLRPSSNAKPGDKIVVTKGAAIEAAAILAIQAEKELTRRLGKKVVAKAKELFFEMSVVEDALTSAKYAHAMHDATEGGLLNGIYEVAEASGVGAIVYERDIIVRPEVKAVCDFFKIDPLIAISEGTLIVTAPERKVRRLIVALKRKGIEASVVGEIVEGKERIFVRKDGTEEKLKPVAVDPFWEAYFSALEMKG